MLFVQIFTTLQWIHLNFASIPFLFAFFSFAIIMVEMCTRQHPYHEVDHLGPAEIVQIVGRLIEPGKTLKLVVSIFFSINFRIFLPSCKSL